MPRGKKNSTTKEVVDKEKQLEDEKALRLLQANLDMLEKSRMEAVEKKDFTVAKRIASAEEDVFGKMALIDKKYAKKAHDEVQARLNVEMGSEDEIVNENSDEIYDIINSLVEDTKMHMEDINGIEEEEIEYGYYDDGKPQEEPNEDVMYDVISLPSNGECYADKKGKIAVSYLTAYDENFITSPNLYRDGLVSEYLLKRKIVDKNINVDELVSGDADAILLFLRASSYGADFPATFTDEETKQKFDVIVDLSRLKVKDFKLKGDENGWFEFVTPLSKDTLKFKYLTKKEEKQLTLMAEMEQPSTRLTYLKSLLGSLKGLIKAEDSYLTQDDKKKLNESLVGFDEWLMKMEKNKIPSYGRMITNRLEMQVMSVNGNTDKSFIRKYVRNMNARDALMLRRYINENEPGIDFSIKIDRPQSLGGGSIDTFLNWDDTVFLSLT